MAGLWHLSNHQLSDRNGRPHRGAKAYFFEAATLDPLTTYQDYSLANEHPHPVEADANGIFPPVFLDEEDGFYRMRVNTSAGVLITGSDVIVLPIVGPGEGGGGAEVPVDPNSLFQTGDVIWLDQEGTRSGWVRDNGRTIGSASSGATERANADCESLFLWLWAEYSNTICPVTGGRGLTAAADWAANKSIQMPDKRGYVPGGLDDMGNSAASRYSGVPVVSGSVTTAGSVIGEATHTLTQAELPTTIGKSSQTGVPSNISGPNLIDPGAGSVQTPFWTASTPFGELDIVNASGGNVHNTVQKTVLGTFYRKL